MPEKQVATIMHYFDKIGVAVLKLSGNLKVGDKLRIEAAEPFVQAVSSMQVNKLPIKEAKPGDDIGMKTDKPCKEGDKVIKLE
jgi:translation elongation factor EF-1alpha